MKEQCNVCQSRVKQQFITYSQWYEGQFILVENVPAWVCEQCGETYFDPNIVEQIQKLIWSNAAPPRLIQTPVYDLKVS